MRLAVPRTSCGITKSRRKGNLTYEKTGTAHISVGKPRNTKPVGGHIPNIKINLKETWHKGVEWIKLAKNLVP
jgi:hypothetical protein